MKPYYNGIQFDSIYELKFALLIEDKCCYIHHPYRIHDVKSSGGIKTVTSYTKSYQPDFLIRNYSNNVASLVEIKGNSDEGRKKRTAIVEKHIIDKNKDYTFHWENMALVLLGDIKAKKLQTILDNQKPHKILFDRSKSFRTKLTIPLTNCFGFNPDQYQNFVNGTELRDRKASAYRDYIVHT